MNNKNRNLRVVLSKMVVILISSANKFAIYFMMYVLVNLIFEFVPKLLISFVGIDKINRDIYYEFNVSNMFTKDWVFLAEIFVLYFVGISIWEERYIRNSSKYNSKSECTTIADYKVRQTLVYIKLSFFIAVYIIATFLMGIPLLTIYVDKSIINVLLALITPPIYIRFISMFITPDNLNNKKKV